METGKQVTSRRFYARDSHFQCESSGRFLADAVYHEKPSVTLERLSRLEQVMVSEIDELKKLLK